MVESVYILLNKPGVGDCRRGNQQLGPAGPARSVLSVWLQHSTAAAYVVCLSRVVSFSCIYGQYIVPDTLFSLVVKLQLVMGVKGVPMACVQSSRLGA